MYALRLEPPPPITTDIDWWIVPIGGAVTHWCHDCAEGQVDDLLDAGAWTIAPEDAGFEVNDARDRVFVSATCEVCGRAATLVPHLGSRH